MKVKRTCKYAESSTVGKQYVKCGLDGSLRKNTCQTNCKKYQPSLRERIRQFFLNR